MKLNFLLPALLFITSFSVVSSQSISSENVEYQLLKEPKILIDKNSRNYSITVTSPYNLTTEEVYKQHKIDFENELKNFDVVVADSKKEFQQKLVDYDHEVEKAKEKYKIESEEFKKLSLLERLTMTDKGKDPKLLIPSKPEYVSPSKPIYHEPNLNNYVIIDNNVLSSQINIDGFSREGNYLTILLDIKKINFQDNAGQTFASQPTTLVIKENGLEKTNKTFFQDFNFVASSPTNNINKPQEERNHLNKVISYINHYLDEMFAFHTIKKSIKLQNVKNKGEYDDLEKADMYVSTNLKKLNPSNPQITAAAIVGMQKGIDIWKETLTKVNYKEPKAAFNAKIAKFVYFNLINLNLALDKKTEAEKYLNEMQENLIYMDLTNSEERDLKQIETVIYKTT